MDHRFFSYTAGLLLCACMLFGLGLNSSGFKPSGIRKPHFQDLEYEKYAVYNAGEISSYIIDLYRIAPDSSTLTVYSGEYDLTGANTNRIRELKDFTGKYVFDLEGGTLLHVTENFSNFFFSTGQEGNYYTEVNYDYKESLAFCTMHFIYHHEITTRKSRVSIKKGFSYFYADNIYAAIFRILDPLKTGVFYVLSPQALKDPIPATEKFLGRQIITNKAGTFSTIKVGGIIADPFLAKLLADFSSRFFIWVDESPSSSMIRLQNTDGSIMDLIETGIWTNR